MERVSWPHRRASLSLPSGHRPPSLRELHPCTLLGEARRALSSKTSAFRTPTLFKRAMRVCQTAAQGHGHDETHAKPAGSPRLRDTLPLVRLIIIHSQLLEPQYYYRLNKLLMAFARKNKKKCEAITKPKQLES